MVDISIVNGVETVGTHPLQAGTLRFFARENVCTAIRGDVSTWPEQNNYPLLIEPAMENPM